MVPAVIRPNASLSELLSERAHAAAPARLWLDVVVGIGASIAAVVFRPPGWVIVACAGGCFCAYGLWACAERRLEWRSLYTSTATERLWRVTRFAAASLGISAFVTMMLAALMLILGTWIS